MLEAKGKNTWSRAYTPISCTLSPVCINGYGGAGRMRTYGLPSHPAAASAARARGMMRSARAVRVLTALSIEIMATLRKPVTYQPGAASRPQKQSYPPLASQTFLNVGFG